MKREQIQDAIDLTPNQRKAFSALKRAVTRCKKEGIYFHQVLESLQAFNGHNVESIDDTGTGSGDPNCTQLLDIPSVNTACGWADDDHFVHLKTHHPAVKDEQ